MAVVVNRSCFRYFYWRLLIGGTAEGTLISQWLNSDSRKDIQYRGDQILQKID